MTVLTVTYLAVVVLLAFVHWRHGAECPWYLAVLFFVPVGILLTLVFGPRRWLIAVAFGVLGAAWIEAAQAIWMPEGYGRVEDTLWGAIRCGAGGRHRADHAEIDAFTWFVQDRDRGWTQGDSPGLMFRPV